MNPIVTAAAIGVGGTVIVGVAGFSAAIWNTRKTIAQAHEIRVWDRRADVYVQTLAAVNYRRFGRQYETMPNHPSLTRARQRAEEYLATHEPPHWSELGPACKRSPPSLSLQQCTPVPERTVGEQCLKPVDRLGRGVPSRCPS